MASRRIDRGRLRTVHTADTRHDRRDAEEAGRLSGDRARLPAAGDRYVAAPGGYRLSRLPSADEQARGEWPDRDEVEDPEYR